MDILQETDTLLSELNRHLSRERNKLAVDKLVESAAPSVTQPYWCARFARETVEHFQLKVDLVSNWICGCDKDNDGVSPCDEVQDEGHIRDDWSGGDLLAVSSISFYIQQVRNFNTKLTSDMVYDPVTKNNIEINEWT